MPTPAWNCYPDDQVLADFSGYVLITISAGGNYDLPTNQPGDTNQLSGKMQGAIAYTNFNGHEQTRVNFSSEVVETKFSPEEGVNRPHHHYRPEKRTVEVTRITGGSSAAAPVRIANLHFSRSMKLSSFQMQIGPLEARKPDHRTDSRTQTVREW